MDILQIKDLFVTVDGKEILKGLNLNIKRGEIHAIMGPNGAGKSTLANILAGHPAYEITSGEIWFKGEDLLELEPEDRAKKGLFLSFQYPAEITGVSNEHFLHAALQARAPIDKTAFDTLLSSKMEMMSIRPEFKTRSINEGFSGGEKKKNEILQMALFEPDLAILDETDSGLDIDAMKVVAAGINKIKTANNSLLIITHYQRLLDYIKPDFVHVLSDGKIIRTGPAELALELEANGYA